MVITAGNVHKSDLWIIQFFTRGMAGTPELTALYCLCVQVYMCLRISDLSKKKPQQKI